jgi:hypothetical protein
VLQVNNKSLFKAHLTVLPDREGVDTLLVTVKGTFTLGEKIAVDPRQVPVRAADECYGDPAATSIKHLSDVSLPKPAVDLLVVGHAYAPGGSATEVDVTLRLGTGSKTIHVIGDRAWTDGLLGMKPTPPKPFEKIPLTWERAFGGRDIHPKQPDRKKAEERNPAGRGFHHFQAPAEGIPLPNLHPPGQHYRGWKDRPDPICFAPISPGWLPRRSFAGTYDQAWEQSRAPFLPADFDPRFLQAAPPDQVIPSIAGGEPLELLNASPNGKLAFTLPRYRVDVRVLLDNRTHTPPCRIDTVIVEPDEQRVMLIWRAALPCDKSALKVREVAIHATPGS